MSKLKPVGFETYDEVGKWGFERRYNTLWTTVKVIHLETGVVHKTVKKWGNPNLWIPIRDNGMTGWFYADPAGENVMIGGDVLVKKDVLW